MRETILVVDDEPDMVFFLRKILESQRYRVIAAGNGEDCLKKIYEEKPDLVVLDLIMPIMDGFGVLRKLRKKSSTSSIPVIILTARADTSSLFLGKELGAYDYIIKPCKRDELLKHIRRQLDLKKAIQ